MGILVRQFFFTGNFIEKPRTQNERNSYDLMSLYYLNNCLKPNDFFK